MLLLFAGRRGAFTGTCASAMSLSRFRTTAIWLAQTALIAVVLFMLWHPAISVARLRPQQNVVAVLVDHSRSMGSPRMAKPGCRAPKIC